MEGVVTTGAIQILLIDHRTVVREGIAALLEREQDLRVVAHVGTVVEACGLGVAPSVVVTELDLPDARHADVVAGLRRAFPQSSVLVLTDIAHPAKVQSALAAGADGYVLKTAPADTLLTGTRAVAGGARYLQPSLGAQLAHWLELRTALTLSPQEETVLRLLTLGHTNAVAARRMGVSVRTVETQRARLYEKLGCSTRAGLVERARELGLGAHSAG